MTLGILITGISVWWVSAPLKEGNKALEESKKKSRRLKIFYKCKLQDDFEKKIRKLRQKIPPLFSGGDNETFLRPTICYFLLRAALTFVGDNAFSSSFSSF